MNFLPTENVTYKSHLNVDQVINRISQNTEPKDNSRRSWMSIGNNHKVYEGTITDRSFSLRRIISYQNSFLPQISGKVQKDNNGSVIVINMKVITLVSAGVIIICLFFILFSWSDWILFFTTGTLDMDSAIFLFAPLFGYAMLWGGFKYESLKSKAHLKQLFDANIVQ